ncbi:hypothetical protein F5Y18DRAFT_434250 [Xylariaceae sp. FL1019]|nr:hypothetical protein F5Y18DRAFT_434250 [Xylariaceae sp. FL1019]
MTRLSQSIVILVLGLIPLAAAWGAEFYATETGCYDGPKHSGVFNYTGQDLTFEYITDDIPCLNLGELPDDQNVTCTLFNGPIDPPALPCDLHGFVARSVRLWDIMYCVGWESAGCTGKDYLWEIDQSGDGRHPGIEIRSFKCIA